MKSKLRARTPIVALTLLGLAALFIAACSTNEVEIPGLTGPSGSRLFINIEASPDKLFIRGPNQNPSTSRITLQLKNQLGEGVPNARIAVKITNADGSEVGIGNLDHLTVVTDSAGFARVTYTAPSTAQQPVPVQVFLRAILTDPAYAFEVVTTHRLDLELARDFDCVSGPGSPDIAFDIIPANPIVDQQVCFDAQGTTDNGAIISFSWDFGDNRTDSGSFVCHTYTREGTFPVTLTVIDGDQNCVSLTQLVTVGVGGAPTCSFTTSPNPVNTDTLVFFDASASQDADGNIVSYSWNFGDGRTGRGERVTHSYENEGTFTVTLIVTDNAGNESTCTQTVTVGSGLPLCDFDFQPASPNTDDVVTFDAGASTDPDGGTLTFAWDFDDDGAFDDGTGEVETFQFPGEGTFLVTLQIRDNEGNIVTCSQTVTVGSDPPACSFIASPTTANIGDTINFNATASSDPDGTIVNFAFDFGDGTAPLDPNTDPTVSHVFTSEGSFIVTLTVTDNDGNTSTCTQTITIGSEPPTCSFTASPTTVNVGGTVNFNASASTDPDGTITNLAFDFGDGSVLDPNTDPTVSHVYTTAGTFVVTLAVTDNDGNTTTCTQNVTVGNALPLCTFTAAPNSGTPPLAVSFNASGSTDQDEGGASIVSYAWDFGDGNAETNTVATTAHTYTTTGTFTAVLIVTDDEGGTSTCQRTITTTGVIPTAAFTATPPSGTLDNQNDPILFDASGSVDNDELGQSIVQYQWDFGDGSAVVTTANPQTNHTFVNPGNFTVTLTVTDDEGQTDTDNQGYIVDADGP